MRLGDWWPKHVQWTTDGQTETAGKVIVSLRETSFSGAAVVERWNGSISGLLNRLPGEEHKHKRPEEQTINKRRSGNKARERNHVDNSNCTVHTYDTYTLTAWTTTTEPSDSNRLETLMRLRLNAPNETFEIVFSTCFVFHLVTLIHVCKPQN